MKDLTWLSLLPLELDSVLLIPPKTAVQPGDHLLEPSVEIPSDIAKLYSLYMATRKEADRLELELKYADPAEAPEITKRYNRYTEAYHCLSGILWISVKDYFNLWDKTSIGIRKGGEGSLGIVIWSDSPPAGPMDFIRRMFEGGP